MSVKHFILLMLTSVTLVAQPSETKKIYGIETGQVEYEIYGGGVVTPECNLSIEGYEKLSFKEWGNVRIEEMERRETLLGALRSLEKEKTLKKSEKDTLYTVDFENERIITSNLLEGDIGQIDLSHMQKTGMMNVASLDCEVWEESTRKVCLYEGIMLLDEKRYLGFVYGKQAKIVNFDLDLSEKIFALPDYPVKEDLLMRSKIKTTQTYKAESISYKILHSQQADIDPDTKEYTKVVDTLVEELFKKEKQYLPLLLKFMHKTRACLHAARTENDTKECFNVMGEFKSKYNDECEHRAMLSIEKQKILDDIDKKIRELKIRIPCINRAADMTDLSSCMK